MSEPSKSTQISTQDDTGRTPDTFERIERLFRRYRMYLLKREAIRLRLTPSSKSVVTLGKDFGEGWAAEEKVCEVADLDFEIRRVKLCLRALTKPERYFVEARYFTGLTVPQAARELGVSVREAYRIRQSVIVKSAFVLGWCQMR